MTRVTTQFVLYLSAAILALSPSARADADGNVLVFWHVFQPPQNELKQRHYRYFSRSVDNGASFASEQRLKISNLKDLAGFSLHVPTPANENDEIYPAAVANPAGQVLFLRQVGPMSTTGHATVRWAIYKSDGTFTGTQGTLGVSTSGTKPTAFVGADQRFYIVTTAREIEK